MEGLLVRDGLREEPLIPPVALDLRVAWTEAGREAMPKFAGGEEGDHDWPAHSAASYKANEQSVHMAQRLKRYLTFSRYCAAAQELYFSCMPIPLVYPPSGP